MAALKHEKGDGAVKTMKPIPGKLVAASIAEAHPVILKLVKQQKHSAREFELLSWFAKFQEQMRPYIGVQPLPE